ncbi:MAG: hypothetical protein E7599_04205 [Ruminococcaceae bacterium]|nr:hypothetical protein [Oscillospiraceae bacterium]
MLGTTETMKTSSDDKFLERFLTKIEGGDKTIQEALAFAYMTSYQITNESEQTETVDSFPGYYVGDVIQYIN